jgi:hypothetical protein
MGCGSCGGGCGAGVEVPTGLVTELVLADEREARAVAEDPAPCRRWPGIGAPGLDQVKLATLWAVLSGAAFGDHLLEAFAPLEEVSPDGPWVFRVPPPLVEGLAALEAGRAADVASAWAATDELVVDGWEAAEARERLDALRGVARAASAARKPLLMWVRL